MKYNYQLRAPISPPASSGKEIGSPVMAYPASTPLRKPANFVTSTNIKILTGPC